MVKSYQELIYRHDLATVAGVQAHVEAWMPKYANTADGLHEHDDIPLHQICPSAPTLDQSISTLHTSLEHATIEQAGRSTPTIISALTEISHTPSRPAVYAKCWEARHYTFPSSVFHFTSSSIASGVPDRGVTHGGRRERIHAWAGNERPEQRRCEGMRLFFSFRDAFLCNGNR